MRSHPVGLDVWFLVGPFIYFHTSCVSTAKVLARLRRCAGSPEPSLVAYVYTITAWAGSNSLKIWAYKQDVSDRLLPAIAVNFKSVEFKTYPKVLRIVTEWWVSKQPVRSRIDCSWKSTTYSACTFSTHPRTVKSDGNYSNNSRCPVL